MFVCTLRMRTLLFLAFFFGASGPLGAENKKSNPDASRAACIAFQAKLAQLGDFKCTFTLTKANASSASKALAGEYANERKCDFLLVVRGEQKKFASITEIRNIPPKGLPPGGSYSVDFIPIADLSIDGDGFRHTSDWKQATIIRFDAEHARGPEKPFELLNAGPSNLRFWLDLVDKQKASLSGGLQNNDGRPLILAEFTFPEGHWQRLFFDPNSGYLPRKIEGQYVSPKGKKYPETQTHVLNAKDVGKGRWFPMHIVKVGCEQDGGTCHVTDIRVNELIVDQVTDADLTLEIPAGTTIFWEIPEQREPLYMRLRQNEKIAPKDIPRIKEMLKQKAVQPVMDTAVHDYRKPTYTKWYLLASGVALFGLGFVVYRRYRSGQG